MTALVSFPTLRLFGLRICKIKLNNLKISEVKEFANF